MTDPLKQHYRELFSQHGRSPKSLQWSNRETQTARFQILTEPVQQQDSIVDLGCGLGDLLTHLRSDRGHQGDYLGLDFLPEFIDQCNESFGSETAARFRHFDIREQPIESGYDWYLVSGVFNNLMENNQSFIRESLKSLYAACEKGVSFNALSTYVDYQDKGLYYTDPLDLFEFCKTELCSRVTLRHDYLVKPGSIPFEFTIYLWKD